VGVADAARDVALRQAQRKRDDRLVQLAVGEMDTLLAGADIALEAMIQLANEYDYEPDVHRSNKVYMYKTLAARSVLGTVEKALEVTGGASFFRSLGLERLFRDAQGVRFHPFQEKRQFVFSGRVALELGPID
jgi:alkylation response protein AidB-like acyl-CoA dehydrogenase